METLGPELNQQTRTYFLLQGQSIGKLYSILNSNILVHHLSKWFSVLFEIILYLFFIATVISAIILPTDINSYIPINDVSGLGFAYYNEDFETIVIIIKLFYVLVSLPMFAFARLMARNRKKNNLIREAFTEAEKMKTAFDLALKELNL